MMKSVFLIAMFAFSIATCMNSSIQESKSVSDFVGPKVKGKVREYRPRALAKFTPGFLQSSIGKEYFHTARSAFVHIYLDPAEREKFHREQSPELAIQCISEFSNLHYLDLRFGGTDSGERIDLSPLARCRRIHQLELHRPNTEIVKDICEHTRPKCLALGGCVVNEEMIEAIATNKNIESIQFNFCTITAKQLQALSGMESLSNVHFFHCKPTLNKDGSFDFQVEPMKGGFATIDEGESQLKAKANAWLKKSLPGVSVSGLD